MEGASNPAFVDDSTNQVTVIHTNPETPSPPPLHEAQSVPSIVTTDYDETLLNNKQPKVPSLDDVTISGPDQVEWSSEATLPGDYGSKNILVDDSAATKPQRSTPPPYSNGNYEANIVQSHEKVMDSKDVEGDKPVASDEDEENTGRDTWGKDIEFLLSCIAMSVGLGNVWRFPFIALENGGGAFVIPYVIVLLLIGKPMYYLEMLIGQFSSRGSVKVYDLAPAMRGTGISQALAIAAVTTYYTFLMCLCLSYMTDSFSSVLPWSDCNPEWGPNCIASSQTGVSGTVSNTSVGLAQLLAIFGVASFYSGLQSIIFHYLVDSFWSPLPWAFCEPGWEKCLDASGTSSPEGEFKDFKSSSEFYFVQTVLREKADINDGLGVPNYKLVIYLGITWVIIALLLIKGVKSSGKASYFLAIFPYVVMGILFVRAVTLPGAARGLEYFFTPQWDKLLEAKVWYEAVTQCFFSLSVGFGNVIMYSSYNRFRHNVSRDATIVTTLDTFTSLLAGSTVFAILGHLAFKLDVDDISTVVKGGPGLAFISYPDAIAKFDWAPQFFSFLFFFMLYVLGIGSNVAMVSCITTIFKDYFKGLKNWVITGIISFCMFCIAIVYTTPGGQFVLELVNLYGVTFIALAFAICELAAFSWVYGMRRLAEDVFFMLGYRPNVIWRWCWALITPGFMIIVFVYFCATWESIEYNGVKYSSFHYGIGWCMAILGLVQLPIWMGIAFLRQKEGTVWERIVKSFKPHPKWGPTNPALNRKYKEFIAAYD